MHAQFDNRKSESTVFARESNSRHFGCYLAITPQQTSIIYYCFFFLSVKQCYLCLMQKQLRNIFFAKKKTIFTRISMWKFLLIKHLYKLMKYILWRTVTAESWKCFLIWRLINTMLINKSHWSATSTQVKIMQLPWKRQRLISWKEQ